MCVVIYEQMGDIRTFNSPYNIASRVGGAFYSSHKSFCQEITAYVFLFHHFGHLTMELRYQKNGYLHKGIHDCK